MCALYKRRAVALQFDAISFNYGTSALTPSRASYGHLSGAGAFAVMMPADVLACIEAVCSTHPRSEAQCAHSFNLEADNYLINRTNETAT